MEREREREIRGFVGCRSLHGGSAVRGFGSRTDAMVRQAESVRLAASCVLGILNTNLTTFRNLASEQPSGVSTPSTDAWKIRAEGRGLSARGYGAPPGRLRGELASFEKRLPPHSGLGPISASKCYPTTAMAKAEPCVGLTSTLCAREALLLHQSPHFPLKSKRQAHYCGELCGWRMELRIGRLSKRTTPSFTTTPRRLRTIQPSFAQHRLRLERSTATPYWLHHSEYPRMCASHLENL